MWRHPSGNYVVAGRSKDLINRGGEKISAEEVENLILSHPAVLNVACVPVPDPVLGERMCACVILRPGVTLTLPDLVEFLQEQFSCDITEDEITERNLGTLAAIARFIASKCNGNGNGGSIRPPQAG